MTNLFNQLYDDAQNNILQNLNFTDLINFNLTSKTNYKLCKPYIIRLKSLCPNPYNESFSREDLMKLKRWSKDNNYSLSNINFNKLFEIATGIFNFEHKRFIFDLVNNKFFNPSNNLLNLVCQRGCLSLFIFFKNLNKIKLKRSLLTAIEYGNGAIIQFIFRHTYFQFDDDLQEIIYYYNNKINTIPYDVFRYNVSKALISNHFTIIDYLCEKGLKLDEYYYKIAIKNNDLAIIDYLRSKNVMYDRWKCLELCDKYNRVSLSYKFMDISFKCNLISAYFVPT